MKRIVLLLVLLFVIAPSFGAVQTPALTVTFTCNLTGAKCTEFLRLVADSFDCPAGSNAVRTTCVQTKVANKMIQIARSKNSFEASSTATNTFNLDFPDQP